MIIDLIKYIFLGMIQGFTEPIPVSSSGHLLIFQKLIGNTNIDYQTLSIITNFGSLIAIVIIFWNDIKELFIGFFGLFTKKEKKYYDSYKYAWMVVVATIPAGIMGLIVTKLGLFDFLEDNTKFVGATLLVTALFLFLIRNIKGAKSDNEITFKDAIIIGLFQVVALIPGISRSGSTIVGGMKQNLKRDTAFKFSFILYIPISLATMVLGIKDLIELSPSFETLICYFASFLSALIVTYFSAKWFKDIMKKGKLIYFVYYCLIVGTLIILFYLKMSGFKSHSFY